MNKALTLLPSGFADLLTGRAELRSRIRERVLGAFRRFGYRTVEPPLLEFEESLFLGPGSALQDQAFRVVDPTSNRMAAIRADVTPQIVRIASSRLTHSARPLRLSYALPVLRSQVLGPVTSIVDRQIEQIGIELVGSTTATADAEILTASVHALHAIGTDDVVIDLNLPTLVPELLRKADFDPEQSAKLGSNLAKKDFSNLKEACEAASGVRREVLEKIASMSHLWGDADNVLNKLDELELGAAAEHQLHHAREVVKLVQQSNTSCRLLLDPLERRGLEYQNGLSFNLFCPRFKKDLGRGGRYEGVDEACVGMTFDMNALESIATGMTQENCRVLLALHTEHTTMQKLQDDGYETVRLLTAWPQDPNEHARQLDCAWYWDTGILHPAQT